MIKVVGRFAAGLALLTIGAGAGFGIISGGSASAATTFTVNDAGDYPIGSTPGVCQSTNVVEEVGTCTLRAAIEASQDLATNTTIIVPDPSGVAFDAAPAYVLDDESGQLDVNDDGNTVTIQGAGQATVTIEASTTSDTATIRDLKIETGTTADISGITFQYGDPNGGVGGGILNCGTLNLTDSTVTLNKAEYSGGGIEQSSGGSTTLDGVTVSDNSAGGEGGGGIADVAESTDSTFTVEGNSYIDSNTSEGDGGGFEIITADEAQPSVNSNTDPDSAASTVVNVENSTISANVLSGEGDHYGIGIAQDIESTLTVTDSSITDNAPGDVADAYGGGFNSQDTDSQNTFMDDTITGNDAYAGAGVEVDFGTNTFINSTISDNTASEAGGGFLIGPEDGELTTITGSTIAGNQATGGSGYSEVLGDGGGILSIGYEDSCNSIALTDDTIANNLAEGNHGEGGGFDAEGCGLGYLDFARSRGVTESAALKPADGTPATVTFRFDTFNANASRDDGAGGNIELDDDTSATLADSIVAGGITGSEPTTNCGLVDGSDFTSLGYNLIDDTTCGTAASTDIIGTSADLSTGLADNGATYTPHTLTELPATGSPAIGAIPNSVCLASDVSVDQRGDPRPSASGAACTIGAVEPQAAVVTPPPPVYDGYRLAAKDGGAFDFGIEFGGSLANVKLNAPIVGMANEPGPFGYLMVGSDGGVYAFGGAQYFGSLGGQTLPSPIAGIATTADGGGYWLVSKSGTTYHFGDAPAIGSVSGLSAPIVGIAAAPGGGGAWLVGSDGGVFALGTATYEGSLAGKKLNAPIVGIAPTPNGQGYVLVASDGGVFAFGNALFYGSAASLKLNASVVGIAETQTGNGYWLVSSDGGVFAFGGAPFLGSMGGIKLNAPMVGIEHLGSGAT